MPQALRANGQGDVADDAGAEAVSGGVGVPDVAVSEV